MHLLRASTPLVRSFPPAAHGLVRSINRPSTTAWLGPFQYQTRSKHASSRSELPNKRAISEIIQNDAPRAPNGPPSHYPSHFQEDSPHKTYFAEHLKPEDSPPINESDNYRQLQPIKVRYIRPALWAVTVTVGIFAFLAYKEAKLLEDNMSAPKPVAQRYFTQPKTPTPMQIISRTWEQTDDISKMTIGIIVVNGAVHLTSHVLPRYWSMLAHIPAANVNYTLFTSTFLHFGAMHLLFNMWAAWNFMRVTGKSRLFVGDPYHLLAFFLGAGVLSGYAQHLTTAFQNQAKTIQAGKVPSALIRSGGASGALFGIFGAFCTEYPNAGVGLVFIPWSIAASTMLPAVMAFDLYGMVVGIPRLSLGHAAHLSGALIGVAYSYFDGKKNVWWPLIRYFRTVIRAGRKQH